MHLSVQLTEDIGPRLHGHDHFLQRHIAGAFADPVDRALDLTRAILHRGQRVGHGQTEVVVAVHADDGVVDIAHIVLQVSDQRPELLRHGKAHGVWDIDCGRTRGNDRLDNLGEKFRLGARGVLGRELDIFVVRFG